MTTLAAEHVAIIACARRGLGQDTSPVGTEDLDWAAFLAEATAHGLVPLVHGGLRALTSPPPEWVVTALRADRIVAALQRHAEFEAALGQTLHTLRGAGLEPIILKGGALTYLAYPTPGLRTMADIDLLLRPEQLDQASVALRAAGYFMLPDYLPDHHHHLPPLITPDGRFAIELHHHVLPEANPYRLDIDAIRSRAQRRQLGKVEALVLTPEDMLLHLCVHLAWGHRYQWFPLRTLVDILALTSQAQPAVDWGRFVSVAEQTRTAGAVYWPLYLSQVWLQARVPDGVLRRLAPPAVARRLLESVIESPYVLSGNAPSGTGSAVLYNLLRELSLYGGCSLSEQARAVWRTLFPHTDGVAHLPPEITGSRLRYASHLWYPLRLARGVMATGALLAKLLLGSSTESWWTGSRAGLEPRQQARPSTITTGD
jgi:hypothetical protein